MIEHRQVKRVLENALCLLCRVFFRNANNDLVADVPAAAFDNCCLAIRTPPNNNGRTDVVVLVYKTKTCMDIIKQREQVSWIIT